MAEPRSTLRRRASWTLVAFGAGVALTIGWYAALLDERREREVWRSLLELEFAHHAPHAGAGATNASGVRVFTRPLSGPPPADLPLRLARLGPGLHDELRLDGRQVVVLARDIDARRVYLALDITGLEAAEDRLAAQALLGVLVLGLLLVLAGRGLAGALVAPVRRLAARIATLDPGRHGERIAEPFHDAEMAAIAAAIDGYLARLDDFVLREEALIAAANHELRTPLAVIVGALDVLRLEPGLTPGAHQRLERIARGAAGIEQTVEALSFLAAEPADGHRPAEACRFDQLLPEIVRDHEHLLEGSDRAMRIVRLEPTSVAAPARIAHIAIGNLLRNAIEHGRTGRIEIALHDRTLEVRDAGVGMAPETISRVYAAAARGEGTTPGLGLALIGRICARCGWILRMDSAPSAGTTARIEFGPAPT